MAARASLRRSSTSCTRLRAASRASRSAGGADRARAASAAATFSRGETSARGIRVRLADGTLDHALQPAARRASPSACGAAPIVDRNGVAARDRVRRRARAAIRSAMRSARCSASPIRRCCCRRGRSSASSTRRCAATPISTAFMPLLDLRRRRTRRGDRRARRQPRGAHGEAHARREAAGEGRRARTRARQAQLAVAAVVLDVDTGQVLARVQVPDYDPNKPAWQDARARDDARSSRAFAARTASGPTRPASRACSSRARSASSSRALAAVRAQHGRRDTSTCKDEDAQGPLFTLPGLAETDPRLHRRSPARHARSRVDALAVSCNVYFGQLGLALGPEPFARAARPPASMIGYGAPARARASRLAPARVDGVRPRRDGDERDASRAARRGARRRWSLHALPTVDGARRAVHDDRSRRRSARRSRRSSPACAA